MNKQIVNKNSYFRNSAEFKPITSNKVKQLFSYSTITCNPRIEKKQAKLNYSQTNIQFQKD